MNNTSTYWKFALMIATSALAMYLVMYANVFEFSHVYTATMRIYMTLLMVVPMILIMLWFMWSMYPNEKKNRTIIFCSILIWVWIFWAIRSQAWIWDVQWMKAMIPHHSSAILTSSQADLKDPEVQALAKDIVEAQEKEIAEMKELIERLK